MRSLITAFSTAKAQYPRDMVYGLLALLDPSQEIAPDYAKTICELYVDVLKVSVWKQPTDWKGADHYLVSFSHLL